MHVQIESQILCRGQGHLRCSDTLYRRVVRQIQEHNGTVDRTCSSEVGSEEVSFFVGDTNRCEYYSEVTSVISQYLRLTGDLGNLPTLADAGGTAMTCETNEAGVVTAYLTDVTDTDLRVRLLGLDGTADSSYLVTATATNALDRYRPGEFRLAVTNIAPTITYTGSVTNDSPTNAVLVALGDVISLPVTVDDVAADLAAGLEVYWTGEGLESLDAYGTAGAAVLTPNGMSVATNGVTLVTNKVDAARSFWFASGASGLRSATLTAVDKDGGVSTREFWYHVIAPQDDEDDDGLSNWAEWLAADLGYLPEGSYTNACSDGVTPDYWRTVTVDGARRYLGELLSDHDHMDDDWEDAYDVAYVNSAIWDAAADPDGDGWSNWSEATALTDPSLEAKLSLVSAEANEDQRLPEYPIPTVRMKVAYNGVSDAFNSKIVVKAWHGTALGGKPDASWTIGGPDNPSVSCSRFLGVNPNKVVRLNLGPGMIAEQHCSLTFFDPLEEHWQYNDDGGVDDIVLYGVDTAHWHGCNDPAWNDDPTVQPNGSTSAAFGYGSVDYRTGDVTIDFTKLQDSWYGIVVGDNEVAYLDLRRAFVRVNWKSRVVTKGNVKEFHLSLPDEDASTLGYLREGKTTFVVFADANGNGQCDADEPYGFVRDVDVGWDEVPEVPVLLTDDDAGLRFVVDGEGIQRVRVVRTAINGVESRQRTGWSRKVNLDLRNWFAEADFLNAGAFDFDWHFLCEDAAFFDTDTCRNPLVVGVYHTRQFLIIEDIVGYIATNTGDYRIDFTHYSAASSITIAILPR